MSNLKVFTPHQELLRISKGVIPDGELYNLLSKLTTDGYVDYNIPQGTYKINTNGQILLNNKGYVAKREKEDDVYSKSIEAITIAKKSIGWSKWNTLFVILTLIVTIISILIQISLI